MAKRVCRLSTRFPQYCEEEFISLGFGKSVVDLSSWIPSENKSHNAPGGATIATPLYDFPDGKDTGIDLSYMRRPDLDITEVDAISKTLSKEVMREIKKKIDNGEIDPDSTTLPNSPNSSEGASK